MRRKSFSLVLLILIIILVISLVVLLVSLINKPPKVSDKGNQTTVENKLDASFIESLNDIDSDTGDETETQQTIQAPENTEVSDSGEGSTVEFNGHNYKIKDNVETSIDDNKNELKYEIADKNYLIYYGSNASKSFQDLKAEEDLKGYIENEYSVSLTSSLKTGNINGLDLIICSASEDSKQIYLLFTPLTDSEVAYARIYNKTNENELLNDISEPLAEISSIISNKE